MKNVRLIVAACLAYMLFAFVFAFANNKQDNKAVKKVFYDTQSQQYSTKGDVQSIQFGTDPCPPPPMPNPPPPGYSDVQSNQNPHNGDPCPPPPMPNPPPPGN